MESSSIGRLERASQSFRETIQDTSLHPYARFVEPVKSELLARAGLDKTFVRGEGCHLWDRDGERFLDFVAQYGALPFGYNPPRIWESLQFTRQRMLPSTATSSLLDSAGQLAQRLRQLVPYMQHVVFCNSGAECTEVAIKLCRSATGRDRILSTRHGFHGLTTGAAGATGSKEFRDGFVSDQQNFGHVPFGNVEALRQTLERQADKIAAFIVEPIQGEAGINVPPDGYLGQVRDLCSRYGVLMVVDEVQTGLGRTGHMLACDRHGVMPDVLLLAKALGGGLVPVGAVLCQSHAYSDRFGLRHSSTFAGNALACQAGLAALDWLQEDDQALIRHVASTGDFLHTGLLTIKQKFPAMVREVRGRGFMQAIEFDFSTLDKGPGLLGFLAEQELLVHLVASHLLNMHHVRLAPSFVGREVLRIEPPLIADRDQCQRLVSALHDTMQILERRNTAAFLAPLAGTTPQRVLQNSQGITSTTRTAKTGDDPTAAADYRVTNEFGFLIHLSSLEDFARFDESLAVFDHTQLAQLKSQLVRSSEPFVIGSNDFVSSRGVAARGHFVIVPWTPAELQSMPVDEALDQVTRAAEVAAGQGVELIGLGGFTSIVAMGGAALPVAKLPPVTSGNSLTVAATLTALRETCATCGTDLHNSTAAIVGASGQTGRGLAIMLGEQVDRLVLIGRNGELPSSRQRLRQVAAAIVDHLVDVNADWQSTAGPLARDVRQFDQGNRDQLLEKLLAVGRIVLAGHLDELATADVVVTASSATQSFIESAHLRRGAIVVDASRPANVASSVRDRRPDVRWIEGGVMEIPGSPPLDLFAGPHPNHTFACVAEAALWALHPEVRGLSAAITLEPARIRRLGLLARQNGFRVVTGQDQHS